MGYDDLLRLADSVGPASDTQRLATHDDIERANLKCTFAGDLQNLPAHLLPTSETGQKCLSMSYLPVSQLLLIATMI